MSYLIEEFTIFEYINEGNVSPFELWVSNLDEYTARKVNIAISRLELGNFSNCKSLGKGLWELKLVYGPGIRIYFGKRGNIIILLWGGTKNRQSDDIVRSNKYWEAYLKLKEHIEWH